MKTNTILLMELCLCLQVIGVFSAAVSSPADQIANNAGLSRADPAVFAALAEECGSLGVMVVPEGVNANEVRHCADHPLGRNRPIADANVKRVSADIIDKRAGADIFARADQACNRGGPYGCEKGSCWRECGGRGEWCWIAEGNGSGPWKYCKSEYDCRPATGGSCGLGCGSCGCSC